MEKRLFLWVATAELGKYRTGGFGQLGVYTQLLDFAFLRIDNGDLEHLCTYVFSDIFAICLPIWT